MSSRIFKTYRNSVLSHGCNIYQTESDVVMDKFCAYPITQYELPHCKYVLRCCTNCPHISIPSPESDRYHSNTYPTILFIN